MVRIWDATNGQLLLAFKGNQGGINGVAWSPNGTRLASAGLDDLVQVWWVG